MTNNLTSEQQKNFRGLKYQRNWKTNKHAKYISRHPFRLHPEIELRLCRAYEVMSAGLIALCPRTTDLSSLERRGVGRTEGLCLAIFSVCPRKDRVRLCGNVSRDSWTRESGLMAGLAEARLEMLTLDFGGSTSYAARGRLNWSQGVVKPIALVSSVWSDACGGTPKYLRSAGQWSLNWLRRVSFFIICL